MNIIETIAPLPIEELKKYFIDKSVVYHIDYDASALKGHKLLTYLSNLDLPCDIKLDISNVSHRELLASYLDVGFLVKVPSLEKSTILCLMMKRGFIPTEDGYLEFIEEYTSSLSEWEMRLDSLTLYNMLTINDESIKAWVEDNFIEDASDATRYVNFVNLLKYEEAYFFLNNIDQNNLRNYSKLFSEYCFKGKNLYEYWANENNPLFLLTWGIASGNVNPESYALAKSSSVV